MLVGDEAGTWSSGDWSWVESGGDAKVGDGEVWVGGGVSNDMTGLSRSELCVVDGLVNSHDSNWRASNSLSGVDWWSGG